MKVFEKELESLDTLDPEVVERIENARDKVLEAVETASGSEKQSKAIRIQCEAVCEFIDKLWGEGTAKSIFGERTNLLMCLKAFDDILQGIEADTQEQYSQLQQIAAKYSPKRIAERK